ncbi:MAG: MarC family protein [Ignavibacteriaceae bacterium]|jgi:multiple antibiotic resistance protein|nr:MarC family protein [Ignavibacteriaceae bacterium]
MNLQVFLLSFIPLFVAIDIIGTVPIFLGYTHGIEGKKIRKLVLEALITAFIVANLFLISGNLILTFLGITIDDFRIAGGIILLILSITDILSSAESRRNPNTDIGIVPLGVPLIMGPAALTTIIILVNNYGYFATIISMALNLFIVGVILFNARWLIKLIGDGGAKAYAKLSSLFLAAIAVMMIRVGVVHIISLMK